MADTDQLDSELLALMEMSDEDIDLSDAPEITSLRNASIAKYSDVVQRGYDIRAIANWCLRKARSEAVNHTNMWLNKVLYFIYERALIERRTLLTPARVEAWDHGPVFREIYSAYKSIPASGWFERYNVALRQREQAIEGFATEDLKLFEEVWADVGRHTAAYLRNKSHKVGSPWHIVWYSGGATNPGMVIDVDTILGRIGDQEHGNT